MEQNVRGGVSYINTRHCEKKETSETKTELLFIDANNLYGLAQSLPLPTDSFRWLSKEEIEQLDVLQMNDEQEEGYILEIDMIYPKKLHRSHNSFPVAAQHVTITEDMLSPYAKGKLKRFVGAGIRTRDCFHRMPLKSTVFDRSTTPT